MVGFAGCLKRSLIGSYLSCSAALTHSILRGRAGKRDFGRVVVVTASKRNNGITSGARLQWEALRSLGVDAVLLDATAALRNPMFRIPHQPGSAYVFHAGGPQVANLIASVLPHAAMAYRIGYLAWELPDPPPDWVGCDRDLAEIWTPSVFSRDSLARLVRRRLEVVPHHIPARAARQRRGDQPFTVLVMADTRSSWSRKNPEGALRAFHAAFGSSDTARLILKLGGRSADVSALQESLVGLLTPNVEIIRDHLIDARMAALYRSADVFLSLHRAEGYGLPMNEAMAHGLPVVATGWSGNLQFMSPADSCLVPYRLVPVDDAAGIYSGSKWAEPDIDAAAGVLRRLADEPDFYAHFAAAAHRSASAATPQFPFAVSDHMSREDARSWA